MAYKNEKTLWAGRIGIPEKYVKQALKEKDSLTLLHEREQMEIPYNEIKNRIVCYSSHFFKDKFGREDYRLAYFLWKPPTEEEKLKQLSIDCL